MSEMKVQAKLELDASKANRETHQLLETLEAVKATLDQVAKATAGVTAALAAARTTAKTMRRAIGGQAFGGDLFKNAKKQMADVASRRQQLMGSFMSGPAGGGGGGASIGQMIGVGAAVAGVHALTGAFSGLVREAAQYSSFLETAKISIGTVLSQVEHVSLSAAMKMAEGSFGRLQQAAIRGVGELQDYVGVFQNVVAPARAAGQSIMQIEEMTTNAVTAAAALGVDFQQAGRDMNMMATGVAGTDVKLFRILHNMGAIREDAKAFNALSSSDRLVKLQQALAGFSASAALAARTWPGLLSTFSEIRKTLMTSLMGPLFEKLRTAFERVVDHVMANFQRLKDQFGALGDRLAGKLGPFIDRAVDGLLWVIDHFGTIVSKAAQLGAQIQKWAPTLLRAAVAWEAVSLARAAAGVAGGVARGVMGGVNMAAGAALAVGAGGAGAAGAAAAVPEMALFAEALAIIAPLVAPIAIGIVAVGSAFLALQGMWSQLTPTIDIVKRQFGEIFENFIIAGAQLGEVLLPVLRVIGSVILPVLVFAFENFMFHLKVLSVIARAAGAVFAWAAPYVQRFSDVFMKVIADLINGISKMFDFFLDFLHIAKAAVPTEAFDNRASPSGAGMMSEANMSFDPNAAAAAPAARGGSHYDFRGSKISVKQEFREADPDRVMMDMFGDMARFAEQKIQSGFVPALTR